jgi:hypothetical protein
VADKEVALQKVLQATRILEQGRTLISQRGTQLPRDAADAHSVQATCPAKRCDCSGAVVLGLLRWGVGDC